MSAEQKRQRASQAGQDERLAQAGRGERVAQAVRGERVAQAVRGERVALVGLSVRMAAEACQDAGVACWAIDVFGDADTREAAALGWLPAGRGQAIALDADGVASALAQAFTLGDAAGQPLAGWIAVGGFEALPDAFMALAERWPLLGTAPRYANASRDPRKWLATLGSIGLPHPSSLLRAPPAGLHGDWLLKNLRSSGGQGVLRWAGDLASSVPSGAEADGVLWQQEVQGELLSLAFIANGEGAAILGVNAPWAAASSDGELPHRFAGTLAPAPQQALIERHAMQWQAAADALTQLFALRGACGIDLIATPDDWWLLELNARPTASFALYTPALRPDLPQPWMAMHLAACQRGELPELTPFWQPRPQGQMTRALQVVYAPRDVAVSAPALHAALRVGEGIALHDLPHEAAEFAADLPICTLSCAGGDAAEVRQRLACAEAQMITALEAAP